MFALPEIDTCTLARLSYSNVMLFSLAVCACEDLPSMHVCMHASEQTEGSDFGKRVCYSSE